MNSVKEKCRPGDLLHAGDIRTLRRFLRDAALDHPAEIESFVDLLDKQRFVRHDHVAVRTLRDFLEDETPDNKP
jgi:hypothetical protein